MHLLLIYRDTRDQCSKRASPRRQLGPHAVRAGGDGAPDPRRACAVQRRRGARVRRVQRLLLGRGWN